MIHTLPDMQVEQPTYSGKREAIVKMEAEIKPSEYGPLCQSPARRAAFSFSATFFLTANEPRTCFLPDKKCDTCFGEKEPVMSANHGVYIQLDPRQKGGLLFVPRGF